MATLNPQASLRQALSAALASVLPGHDFQRLAGSSAYGWQRGPLWVTADVNTSKAALTAHVSLSCWCPALSAPKAVAAGQVAALAREDGFAVIEHAPRLCRAFAADDFRQAGAVARELEASFRAELEPLLDALRSPADLAVLYMLCAFGPTPAIKRKKLKAILAAEDVQTDGPIVDRSSRQRHGSAEDPPTLIDAARWLSLGGEAVVKMLEPQGLRIVPKSLKSFQYMDGLMLARARQPFVDLLAFHFGSLGRQSHVRCLCWVPEMNGESGDGMKLLDAGVVPESMAAWWLGPAGPVSSEQAFDLTTRRGRAELEACFNRHARSMSNWFEARRSLSDLLEIPEGAMAWFKTPAGQARADSQLRMMDEWKAMVRELGGARYPH